MTRSMIHQKIFLGITLLLLAAAAIAVPDGGGGLPRSRQSSAASRLRNHHRSPPWSLSGLINRDGFVKRLYPRIPGEWEDEVRRLPPLPEDVFCHIRQVPGDGNCLFHSISLCLEHAVNNTHWDMSNSKHTNDDGKTMSNLEDLFCQSQRLRQTAVQCLRQTHRRLFLQGSESLRAHELVQAAAQQYRLTPEEYVENMQQDSVWGGGPEIVALCNILQRPIHVYELAVQSSSSSSSSKRNRHAGGVDEFCLRRMACFGSPRFDRRQALHILSADSRFPDLEAGDQLAQGNHFLAVFPQERIKRRVRGGAEKYSSRRTHENEHEKKIVNAIQPPVLDPPVFSVDDDDDDDDAPTRKRSSWWRKILNVFA